MAQSSVFDGLASSGVGQGKITINQPNDIRRLVGSRSANEKIEVVGDKSYLVVPGYRIQVFSGNNQRKSKDEADSKKRQIDQQYSGVSTYVTFMAPFWRLRVGDYTTYEEAYSMMYKLIESFPSFKKEIHITKEDVRIPLN
jgi:hypothetical protein